MLFKKNKRNMAPKKNKQDKIITNGVYYFFGDMKIHPNDETICLDDVTYKLHTVVSIDCIHPDSIRENISSSLIDTCPRCKEDTHLSKIECTDIYSFEDDKCKYSITRLYNTCPRCGERFSVVKKIATSMRYCSILK